MNWFSEWRRRRLCRKLREEKRWTELILAERTRSGGRWVQIGFRVPVLGDRWISQDSYGAGVMGHDGWCGNDGVWPTSPHPIVEYRKS